MANTGDWCSDGRMPTYDDFKSIDDFERLYNGCPDEGGKESTMNEIQQLRAQLDANTAEKARLERELGYGTDSHLSEATQQPAMREERGREALLLKILGEKGISTERRLSDSVTLEQLKARTAVLAELIVEPTPSGIAVARTLGQSLDRLRASNRAALDKRLLTEASAEPADAYLERVLSVPASVRKMAEAVGSKSFEERLAEAKQEAILGNTRLYGARR